MAFYKNKHWNCGKLKSMINEESNFCIGTWIKPVQVLSPPIHWTQSDSII